MNSPEIKWWRAAGASLLVLGCAGCSLTLDFEECVESTDCAIFGPGLSCTAEGLCVAPVVAGCVRDDDCISQGDRTSCVEGQCVVPAVGNNAGPCTTTACVEQFGENHVCGARGQCVNALTPECTKLVGPVDRDNVVILGSILPTREFADIGLPIQQAVELAVEEINTAGGLPNGRRLVLVGCDSSGDSTQGRRVAEHLVEQLGVPAIVGPAFSSVFIDVNTDVTIPGGVLTISPSATSALITGLDDHGLAWRTVASDVFQGVAIADRVRDLEATKVVVFNKGEAYGQGLSNKISSELGLELGEEGYFSREYADPATQAPDFGRLVNDALAEMPDAEVVVLLGTSEAIDLMELYEIAVAERGLTPPRYILTDGGKSADRLEALFANGEVDEALLTRLEGTEPDHQNPPHFENFDLRFRRRHGAPAGVFAANAYDGLYLVAYALSALERDDAISGAAVAAGLARMVGGEPLAVGPDGINDARNVLQGGGDLDFEGASGPLDFDLGTGEAPANVALWTATVREDGQIRFEVAGRYVIDPGGRGIWKFGDNP